MLKKLTKQFINPSSEYRGAPFWAWNGELRADELCQQIRDMHEMGLGGFFMHSRVGLASEYLSPEWFEHVRTCVDEAKKLNMYSWLYDEDRWPSGAAGGLVTADPEFRARKIICEEISDISKINANVETLSMYLAQVSGGIARNPEKLNALPELIPPGKTLIHFYIELEIPSSWYNGYTYLDTLNHNAVRKFIEITHERYLKELGEDLGQPVPGIFTDEPNYGRVWTKCAENKYGSPWTNKLPEVFKKRYGYDLLDYLMELFYFREDTEVSKVKLNYLDCITHLFVNAFSKQIGEWCQRHNILSTGHMLLEDTLSKQTLAVGSCMQSYEYMQAPGIDILTEHQRAYDTVKQLSSVARQFNRKWRLSETYGCTGWDFAFAGHKALGDWQAALGINLRCQHLSWYTMEGEAKRDYPASIHYQSPWWQEYRKVEDYFARINLAMTQGEEIRDVLVIHPVESMWTMTGKDWLEKKQTAVFDQKLIKLRDCLLGANIDFDYGDEQLLARYGEVDGPVFKIKNARYKLIVVPEMLTIRATTQKMLELFSRQGGRIIFAGTPAIYIDAEKSEALKSLAEKCDEFAVGKELADCICQVASRVSIIDKTGKQIFNTLYQHREDARNAYLFICNTGHENPPSCCLNDLTRAVERTKAIADMTIKLKTAKNAAVLEVNLENGRITRVDAEKTTDGWTIKSSLAALGSRLFIVSSDPAALQFPPPQSLELVSKKELGADCYDIMLSEDNVLVLSTAKLQIEGQGWTETGHILDIDRKVREYLEVQCRGGKMEQPWVRKGSFSTKTALIKLKYEFFCDAVPSGALYLGIEKPETFIIKLNGNNILSDSGFNWWCDRSLKKLCVNPRMLRSGKNELQLECCYSEAHPGFEYVYLLGGFGVKLDGRQPTIITPVKSLRLGDWVEQGLPFYSGAVSYHCKANINAANGERVFLKLPEYCGACVKIVVNGKTSGLIAWPPYEMEISDFLKVGDNDIVMEVFSSRRNSHGPFFTAEKWPRWTGPGQYHTEFIDKFNLVPCGLLKAPLCLIYKIINRKHKL